MLKQEDSCQILRQYQVEETLGHLRKHAVQCYQVVYPKTYAPYPTRRFTYSLATMLSK